MAATELRRTTTMPLTAAMPIAWTTRPLLLQQPGDFVEYDLDLADDVDSALLKLYITSGLVEVKPEGGEFTALTAKKRQWLQPRCGDLCVG